ncbi:acyloxyacyl hydrolase [Pelagovum pacificum]|uniref:Acyloxyacyl hydrolase n=1 Tax=Pelagovum pacificum TaxID=2588711 RepID=A0A5C5GCN5_9RHOB|nr:acyloxyacyl hydrolase [Pelagovum pacificum]QQA44629.1 acyloxyacyl hydrolase [Pelagovum pacificum]TNY32260.1 acyloxyacyl hydrolase [Pelagovum pacificum]
MDGKIALIYLIMSFTDMGVNHCPQGGCIAPEAATERLSFQLGAVDFQEETISSEVYLDYAIHTSYGPFQPVVGVSTTAENSSWIGFGVRSDVALFNTGVVAEGSLMPGYYSMGQGEDLGGGLQFRSSLGLSYEFFGGSRLGVYYDHRSNGDIRELNPGLETWGVRYSIPLN